MAVRHGYGKIAGADALVFAYDTGDTRNSYKGEPTVNYVPGTYAYSLYAYASGPVNTTVLNENNKSITAKRYTITNAVNTARAAIRPSGLTTGVAYTFSFKWKYNGTTTTSPSIGVSAAKGNPEGGSNNNSFTSQTGDTVSIGNGWYLTTYTFVFSSNPTGASILTFGISTGSNTSYLGETFDIYEAQFEIKDHRTPFVNGTRSSTQGLLDLTGNSSIDLSNVSFNSSAEKVFDGTNDYIGVASSALNNLTGPMSCEAVFLIDSNPGDWVRVFGKGDDGSRTYGLWYNYSSNLFLYQRYSSGGGMNAQLSSAGIQLNKYYHMVGTSTANTHTLYINGVAVATATNSNTFYSNSNTMNIGFSNAHTYHHGTIPVAKLYNRALTASEVKNNYNNYKGRFNI